MYSQDEKVLILGSLFHDIGKFEQRCTGNKSKIKHQDLSKSLIESESISPHIRRIFSSDEDYQKLLDIVSQHHDKNPMQELTNFLKAADRLSASERVELDKEDLLDDKWSHKYLMSLFSKLRLVFNEGDKSKHPRGFYRQEYLTKKNYRIIIPEDESKIGVKGYSESNWIDFVDDLKSVFSIYQNENDFYSLVNALLMLFEKYMWCVPDFTGSEETDISLYNHTKDVAGIALAHFRSKKENSAKNKLVLIAGDIPGIQKYIFDINNRKAAKLLRGRSIYIQVLSRMFASYFLKKLKLTECNLIMLAGGKFYIIAPGIEETIEVCQSAKSEIERFLFDEMNLQMEFIYGLAEFDIDDLTKRRTITFGDIVDECLEDMNRKKSQAFKDTLFAENVIEDKFILGDYINDDEGEENVKCYLTDKPILEKTGNPKKLKIDNVEHNVDQQVFNEYLVGEKITDENLIIYIDDDFRIDSKGIESFDERKQISAKSKIVLNPVLDKLIKDLRGNSESAKNLFRNSTFLDVASFVSRLNEEDVDKTNEDLTEEEEKYPDAIMSFEDMKEKSQGAKYLSIIKGDIDNLGLLMAYGLMEDDIKNDLTGISRTTTLSFHLRYYFSTFVNGYLSDKNRYDMRRFIETRNDRGEVNLLSNKSYLSEKNDPELSKDSFTYVIYAGGDDLLFVCPQSYSHKLVKEFNDSFKEFACNNHEVHVSYSITNFKHSTPIRLVSELSEINQEKAKEDKKKFSEIVTGIKDDSEAFFDSMNKSCTYSYDTKFKTERLERIIDESDMILKWISDEKLSIGMTRLLLQYNQILKEFEVNKNTEKLIMIPLLTYSINRNLKESNDDEKMKVREFYESFTSLDKFDSNKLKDIIVPILCSTIYKQRNQK